MLLSPLRAPPARAPQVGVPVSSPCMSPRMHPGSARPDQASRAGGEVIWRWRGAGAGASGGVGCCVLAACPRASREQTLVSCVGTLVGLCPCGPGVSSILVALPPALPTSPPRSQLGLLGFRGEMRAGSLRKPLMQVQASSVDDHVGTGPQGTQVGKWPGKGAGPSALEANGPGLGSWPCFLCEAVLTSAAAPGLWEAGLGLRGEAQ